MQLHELSARAAADAIRRGELTSEALVRACLDRIARTEDRIRAWAWLDPDQAIAQARAADRAQADGARLGALHGVPVGIKDIFDTADMPTEYGTVLHQGRRPREDATVVALLRKAGAVIMGKTVTTELAVYAPGKTTNPHDERRTPGGSSSGSAAAVAACMVPLAVGTQTNGSLIRPASYCGVYGFKPSHGAISRHGVLKQSPTLDHVGVFARSVEDVAMIARELYAWDGKDLDVAPGSHLELPARWEQRAARAAAHRVREDAAVAAGRAHRAGSVRAARGELERRGHRGRPAPGIRLPRSSGTARSWSRISPTASRTSTRVAATG